MSKPEDKIQFGMKYLFTPQDVTRVDKEVDTSDIGWREVVNQYLPEQFRLTPTSEIEKEREISRVRLRGLDREQAERLIASGGDIGGIPIEPSIVDKIIPAEIREFFRPSTTLKESPASKIAGTTIDVLAGETGGLESLDPSPLFGAASSVFGRGKSFGEMLYSRIDDAIESFPQTKGTAKQWLAHLKKGVPEVESVELKRVLEGMGDDVLDKGEVVALRHSTYEAPRVGEFPSPIPQDKRVVSDDIWKQLYRYKGAWIYETPNGTWAVGIGDRKTVGSKITDLKSAMKYIDEANTGQYVQYTRDKGKYARGYEEVVLTLDTPDELYRLPSYWSGDAIRGAPNPISHIRMSTRDIEIPGNLLTEPQGVAEEYIKELMKDGWTRPEAIDILKKIKDLPSDIPTEARQIEEIQSYWGQDIREKGARSNFNIDDIKIPSYDEIRNLKWETPINISTPAGDIEIIKLRSTGGYSIRSDNFEEIYQVFSPAEVRETVNDVISNRLLKEGSLPPSMPFSKTDQWVDLSIERAIFDAAQRDIDILTWTPGKIQYDLYGSELFKWEPKGVPKYLLEEAEAIAKKYLPEFENNPNGATALIERAIEVLTEKEIKSMAMMNNFDSSFVTDIMRLKGDQRYDTIIDELIDYAPDLGHIDHEDLREALTKIRDTTERSVAEYVAEQWDIPEQYVDMLRGTRTRTKNEIATNLTEFGYSPTEALKAYEREAKRIANAFEVRGLGQFEGNIGEFEDLGQAAIQAGHVRPTRSVVSSKEELRNLVESTLVENKDIDKITENLWKRMQGESEGVYLPRKEGNEYFYDKIIPKRVKEVLKKIGVKGDIIDVNVKYGDETITQKGIKITPELKRAIMEKGLPLFGAAGIVGADQMMKKEKEPMDHLFDSGQ